MVERLSSVSSLTSSFHPLVPKVEFPLRLSELIGEDLCSGFVARPGWSNLFDAEASSKINAAMWTEFATLSSLSFSEEAL